MKKDDVFLVLKIKNKSTPEEIKVIVCVCKDRKTADSKAEYIRDGWGKNANFCVDVQRWSIL